MLSRRTFGTSSALAATLTALPGVVKAAAGKPTAAVNVDPRGDIGKLRRLPTLEQERRHQANDRAHGRTQRKGRARSP